MKWGSRHWMTPARSSYSAWSPLPANAAPWASPATGPSWGRFLPEHTTAVSMLDRLLHHCHVVVTNGDSYRMKQARARGGDTRKPS